MLCSRTGWFKYEEICAALLMNKGVTCVGAVGLLVLQNMVWCPPSLVWFLRGGVYRRLLGFGFWDRALSVSTVGLSLVR